MDDLTITDTDGDSILLEDTCDPADGVAFLDTTGVTETSGGVYLSREAAESLRDRLSDYLGDGGPSPSSSPREDLYRQAQGLAPGGACPEDVLALARFLAED